MLERKDKMIRKIAVIGAGTMGHGIANTFARHGYDVRIYDSFSQSLDLVLDRIRGELEFMVSEDYITQSEAEDALGNVTVCRDLASAVSDADYVIEAITEKLGPKKALFKELDALCPPETVFASNTSSLKLQDIIEDLPPERQKMSMVSHWYNPAYLIPCVELSKFGNMDDEVFDQVMELYVNSGKKPVRILKDVTGMITNRLLHALAREAFRLVEEGVGEKEDVDNALKYGPCFRGATTGMMDVADMGGLDVWVTAEDNIFPALDNSDRACGMMRKLVEEGHYGLKTGKGFGEYPEGRAEEVQKDFLRRLITQLKASEYYE